MTSYAHLVELEEIRGRYRDKRSVAYRLLDEVLDCARSAVAEAEGRADGRIVEVERYHQSTKALAEVLQRRVRQLEDARTLREERAADADDLASRVTIAHGGGGGWTVGELEEVAYRLRSGGAVDDTVVAIGDRSCQATVPAPNMVDLSVRTGPTPSQLVTAAIARDPRLSHERRRHRIPFPSTGPGLAVLFSVAALLVSLLRVVGVLG